MRTFRERLQNFSAFIMNLRHFTRFHYVLDECSTLCTSPATASASKCITKFLAICPNWRSRSAWYFKTNLRIRFDVQFEGSTLFGQSWKRFKGICELSIIRFIDLWTFYDMCDCYIKQRYPLSLISQHELFQYKKRKLVYQRSVVNRLNFIEIHLGVRTRAYMFSLKITLVIMME